MKLLITGASGFLGSRLVSKLLDEKHQVVLLQRSVQAEKMLPNCTYVEADITNKENLISIKKDISDIDTVVHMAALVPKTKEEDLPAAMFDVNAGGTINLLEVFGSGLGNFVYASTAEVYGLPAGHEPLVETMIPQPLSYYGASKLAGELFCNVFAKQNELLLSILRFTVLYGPGDHINRAVPNFIKKALKGQELEVYGGEELRDYLHVNDAAEALYLAAVRPTYGTFNIGTGKGISILDTANAIVKAVNPDGVVKILNREKPAADIVLNIDKAVSELGFKAKHTFPDLIEEQIEWHRQQD